MRGGSCLRLGQFLQGHRDLERETAIYVGIGAALHGLEGDERRVRAASYKHELHAALGNVRHDEGAEACAHLRRNFGDVCHLTLLRGGLGAAHAHHVGRAGELNA
jgi:hypothetical protein